MNDPITINNCLEPLRLYIHTLETRVTALEGVRQCSDSHAPFSASASVIAGQSRPSPVACITGTPAVGGKTDAPAAAATDSARRALADNNRPAWLTREMCESLPEGTERVYLLNVSIVAAPSMQSWTTIWTKYLTYSTEREMADHCNICQVYHLPPAAKGEGTKHDALYDAARRFILSGRFEEDNAIQQALAEAVRQLTPMRDDPVHDTHPRPEKPKPDAGRAEGWECLPTCGLHRHSQGCPLAPKLSPGEVAEDDLIEGAWSLLANVGSLGGGWASQGSVWQMAAQSWRDKYTKRAGVRERPAP